MPTPASQHEAGLLGTEAGAKEGGEQPGIGMQGFWVQMGVDLRSGSTFPCVTVSK